VCFQVSDDLNLNVKPVFKCKIENRLRAINKQTICINTYIFILNVFVNITMVLYNVIVKLPNLIFVALKAICVIFISTCESLL